MEEHQENGIKFVFSVVSIQFSHHRKYSSSGNFCCIVKEHEHRLRESSCTRHTSSLPARTWLNVNALLSISSMFLCSIYIYICIKYDWLVLCLMFEYDTGKGKGGVVCGGI